MGEEAFGPWMIAQKGRKSRRIVENSAHTEIKQRPAYTKTVTKGKENIQKEGNQGSQYEVLMDWRDIEEDTMEVTGQDQVNTENVVVTCEMVL